MVRPEIVLAQKYESVVRSGNLTVVTLNSRGRFSFGRDQPVEYKLANDPRSFLGSLLESLYAWRLIVNLNDRLRCQCLSNCALQEPTSEWLLQPRLLKLVVVEQLGDDIVTGQAGGRRQQQISRFEPCAARHRLPHRALA